MSTKTRVAFPGQEHYTHVARGSIFSVTPVRGGEHREARAETLPDSTGVFSPSGLAVYPCCGSVTSLRNTTKLSVEVVPHTPDTVVTQYPSILLFKSCCLSLRNTSVREFPWQSSG